MKIYVISPYHDNAPAAFVDQEKAERWIREKSSITTHYKPKPPFYDNQIDVFDSDSGELIETIDLDVPEERILAEEARALAEKR